MLDRLQDVFRCLEENEVKYLVIGGIAAILYGVPRATFDLDILIEGDKVTIRGKREKPPENGKRNYFYQECFWGPFFREIILPVEIDPSRAKATLKEGILKKRIEKIEKEKKRKIEIKE